MHSLKKELIVKFALSTTVEEMENNKLILLTPAGLVSGELVTESNSPEVQVLDAFTNKLATQYKEDNNIDEATYLDGNDGYLSLENVTINHGSSSIKMPFINVFFDQIIGVTLGSKSN